MQQKGMRFRVTRGNLRWGDRVPWRSWIMEAVSV